MTGSRGQSDRPVSHTSAPTEGKRVDLFELEKVDTRGSTICPYSTLQQQLVHLIDGERDPIANAANTASLLYHALRDVNWAGFYRWVERDRMLVLGPFHGQPACIRIAEGRGVCGTAAARKETVVVADVHDFPGHIACDANSESEIVVPLLMSDGTLLGVLDIDSPVTNRFDAAAASALEELVRVLVEGCTWPW